MGIQIEFNPDLALRNINYYKSGKRSLEECIPEKLEKGNIYGFLKEGQRNYWLIGEIPLVQTEGEGILSKPLASIVIFEATHFTKEDRIYTKGKYEVKELFNPSDNKIHFNGFTRIK
jgi:hypothetical protein